MLLHGLTAGPRESHRPPLSFLSPEPPAPKQLRARHLRAMSSKRELGAGGRQAPSLKKCPPSLTSEWLVGA